MSTSSVSSAQSWESSQPTRYTGLVGGIDVDSIVQKLMTAEEIPLNNLLQQQQIMQWQEDQYRDLNSKVLTLQNQSFNLKLQSSFQQYTTSSSNSNVVTATAASSAGITSYTFNQINSLASAANITTAAGSTVSRQTSVITSGIVTTPINTNTTNTFQINYNGKGFVNVSLAAGKTYDGATPGGTLNDLVTNLQSAVDTALSGQGVAAGTVKVTLTPSNTIQFTTNNATGAPPTLVLQEGASNDLLTGGLGFTPNSSLQVTATNQNVDLTQSLYTNLQEGRFANSTDFGWLVNGSYSTALSSASSSVVAGTSTTGVAYNNTNISNYAVSTIENQAISLGAPASSTTTTVNFNSANISNVSVYVNGTKYTAVSGVAQSALQANQVSVDNDGTGHIKLTFQSSLAAGTNIQVDQKTTYSVVTGVAQSSLTASQALLTQDPVTGKAQFTFLNQMAAGTQVNVDRHDFQFSTSVYNQDGSVTSNTYTMNAMTQSMNDFMNQINTTANSDLTAFYDTGTDKMVLTSTQTGKNNTSGNDISLTGNFLTGTLALTGYTDGVNASFTINGLATTRKANSFTINGVTFNLVGTTPSTSPVTVNTSVDVNTVYNNIKAFVDQYNTTIAAINEKLTEKRDYNYLPLSDAQKAQMKDTDITNWNNKAQQGLLAGDPMLESIVDTMRKALYDPVTSTGDTNYDQLTQIGITTSQIYQDNGKLIINDATLKNAIAQNPSKVMAIFTNTSTATDATQNYNASGLATRIYNDTQTGIDNITAKAGTSDSYSVYDGSSLGKQLAQTATDIYNLQQTLNAKETQYYNEFTAMETALNQMNAQSQWISAQMGGSSGG